MMGKSLDIYHQNAALYDALKEMEGVAVTMAQARTMLKKAYPKITKENTMIRLLGLEHLGYIEGFRGEDGKIVLPINVKITEKGHEHFKRMVEKGREGGSGYERYEGGVQDIEAAVEVPGGRDV